MPPLREETIQEIAQAVVDVLGPGDLRAFVTGSRRVFQEDETFACGRIYVNADREIKERSSQGVTPEDVMEAVWHIGLGQLSRGEQLRYGRRAS